MHNYIFLIAALIFSSSEKPTTPISQNISNWKFLYEKEWLEANVPGNNFSDLLHHNLIPDPFYGNNEDSVQWVSKKEWIYRSDFIASDEELERENISLTFLGLDTYSEIYLNNQLILETNNMFKEWTVDVKEILTKNNTLRVRFIPVDKIEEEAQNKLGYNLPGGNRVFTRKAAFHYGWDWGPKLITSGIWRNVKLNSWNNCKINNIIIKQDYLTDTLAKLVIDVKIEATSEHKINLQVNEKNIRNIRLKKGSNQKRVILFIKNPELWWPNGYGNQKLYNISIAISDSNNLLDYQTKKIGLRTIQLITEKDSIGESFYFKINNKPLFMKGANYIPQDNLQNRVTKNHYLNLLTDVKKSNMNMLRVWGGGIYEEDLFYNLCDSLGILIWQDFMFACGMYPSDSSFLKNVEEEAIYNVKRLHHHPCIALWCGNNENSEGWKRWGWQDNYSKKQKKEIWKGYQKLFNKILPKITFDYSQTNYWESSPKLGRGNPQHKFEGDAHYWGVWHDQEPFTNFETKVPRFMSEFGFQAYPSLSTISTFSNNLNINSSEVLNHQKHPRGNKLISEYMREEFNIPKDFKKYLYASQILQAEGIRLGIEAHRRNKPVCMGTLYWQLNDCWPAISWSSRDYHGKWKALQYAVQDAYSHISLSIYKSENNKINIYGISDYSTETNDILDINIYSIKKGLVKSISKEITIPENNSILLFSEKHELNNDHFIIASLRENNIRSKTLFLTQTKNIVFPDPQITYSWEENKLILRSKKNAFQVYLHGIDSHFSDNFFTLIQGEEKIIEINTNNYEKNNLVIWSLYNLNK